MTLLGIPIFYGGECIGVLEIANRKDGYKEEMIPFLYGVRDSIGVLLTMYSQTAPTAPDPSLDFNAGEVSSALVQSISDGIVVTDADLNIRLMNRGALQLFGYTTESEVEGLDLQDMVDPVLVNNIDWVRMARSSCESMTGVSSEGTIYDRNRKKIPVIFSMTTFLFSRRRYLCFILSDLRDKRSYEEKIRFLAFLSHELRTPIQVIVSGLQELSHQETKHLELDKENLQLLIDASNMVTRVVDSVLELSKLESGTVKIREEQCHVRHLMEAVLAIVRSAKVPTVHLILEIKDNVPEVIEIDQVRNFRVSC